MKKLITALCGMLATGVLFFSCASTLQEDVLFTSDLEEKLLESIAEYENTFIKLDSSFIQGYSLDENEINDFETKVLNELKNPHLEPAVCARLDAFMGLTALFKKNNKTASDFYTNGKTQQASDEYVNILGCRLEKNKEKQLEKIESCLEKDSRNALLILEKGKILFNQANYAACVASFDSAFLIFDEEEKTSYRATYSAIREKAWSLYSSGIEDNESLSSIAYLDVLTKETMIELTFENSTLLEDFVAGSKMHTRDLIKKLNTNGFFCSPVDPLNENESSKDIMNSDSLNKALTARFLWNLYLHKKGKRNMANRYSKRYLSKEDSVSPISDVDINSPDFDSIMGVIEAEIMSLPDGKNFSPEAKVSSIDFITYIKNADK